MDKYCARCLLLFEMTKLLSEMAKSPEPPWDIAIPYHHPRCPKVAQDRPEPLRD